MISARNQIAHNSWTDLTEDDEDRFETIAQKAHDVLANYLEEANEGAIVPVIELGELDDMTSTENH